MRPTVHVSRLQLAGIVIVIFYRILAKLLLPSLYSLVLGWSPAKTRRESTKAANTLEVVPSVVDLGSLGDTDGQKQQREEARAEDAWRRGRIAKQGEGEVLKNGREVLTKVLVYGGIGESHPERGRGHIHAASPELTLVYTVSSGLLATELIPLAFVGSGVGLR